MPSIFRFPARRLRVTVLPALLLLCTLTARAQTAGHPSPETPAAAKPGVEVTGQVKIMGGNPGAGRILTSDANGVGTWTAPVTTTLVCTGTLPKEVGATVLLDLPAEVNPAAIVGISAVVPLAADEYVPPGYTALADRYYNVSVVGRRIRLDTTNHSAAVLGKAIKVLLTYQP